LLGDVGEILINTSPEIIFRARRELIVTIEGNLSDLIVLAELAEDLDNYLGAEAQLAFARITQDPFLVPNIKGFLDMPVSELAEFLGTNLDNAYSLRREAKCVLVRVYKDVDTIREMEVNLGGESHVSAEEDIDVLLELARSNPRDVPLES